MLVYWLGEDHSKPNNEILFVAVLLDDTFCEYKKQHRLLDRITDILDEYSDKSLNKTRELL